MFERVRTGRFVGCVALALGATVGGLGPGCATTSTPDDGQSHWLGECSSDGDCGDLECICGTCTRACWRDDSCGSVGEEGACRSIAAVARDATCAGSAAPASVCTLTCGRDADCRGYGPSLACSAGVCIAASGAQTDGGVDGGSGDARAPDAQVGDSSVTPDGTAHADASGPPPPDAAGDAGPVSTAELFLDCDDLEDGTLPSGVQAFRTTALIEHLTVAGSTVYGAGSGELWKLVEPAGPVEHLFTPPQGPNGPYMQPLVADGEDLFYGRDEPIGVAKYTPATDTVLNLALDASFSNILAIIVDGAHVYWLVDSGGSPRESSLMRSDRDPGTTTTLATVGAQQLGALQLLGDWFYFVAIPEGTTRQNEAQLYRVPKAGGTGEALGAPSGVLALSTDGTNLFAGLRMLRDGLGNPAADPGVARVNLASGALTPLFTTPDVVYRAFEVDDTNLYWITGTGLRGSPGRIWRGRKDGSGSAVTFAEGWTEEVFGLAVTSTAVYWTLRCVDTNYLVRAEK